MASRRKRKNAVQPDAPLPQSLLLRPVLDATNDPPQFYANHAEVNFTSHDFTITFGRMSSRITPEQAALVGPTGIFRVPADVQVVVPATLVVGLIRALSTQRDAYEQQYEVELKESPGARPPDE